MYQGPKLMLVRLQQPKPCQEKIREGEEREAPRTVTWFHRGSVTTVLSCADLASLSHPPSLHTSSWSRVMNSQVLILLALLTTDSFLGLLRILGLGTVLCN